ncbi:hypothetical protein Acsp04_39300 [Actinomadura sp. NBRC 104425]|uniref:hypothetical protein n=1 Tax=Actinomadura sp. NBRC 104425 TaxID=3032204 RepID=UPI0024A0BCE9|nr:hypothetical protein [Actinomadura sp. NBRC 104425]GLZ13695.1 hypothetical protein Acsp04_39300 [Actinomadura sp. NBRC 104425]
MESEFVQSVGPAMAEEMPPRLVDAFAEVPQLPGVVHDAMAHLEELRHELISRGWKADIRRTDRRVALRVSNPEQPRLNDDIVCDGEVFRWPWGQGIGAVGEVAGVAERVMYVLREVGE